MLQKKKYLFQQTFKWRDGTYINIVKVVQTYVISAVKSSNRVFLNLNNFKDVWNSTSRIPPKNPSDTWRYRHKIPQYHVWTIMIQWKNDGLLKYVSWKRKGDGFKYFLNSSNYKAEMLELNQPQNYVHCANS